MSKKTLLWLLVPGGTLVILYLLATSKKTNPVFAGTPGASQTETGNPVSPANNPGNLPGGVHAPLEPAAPTNTPSFLPGQTFETGASGN